MRSRQIFHKHFLYSRWYIRLLDFLKRVHLRKRQASLYIVLIIFLDKVADNQIFERAYGVAFNFTLAVFPSIIFLFTLIPFLHTWIPSISQGEILHFLKDVLPESLFQATAETIYDTLQIRREGLMSFGVLFALYLATNGVNSLMKSFNMSHKTLDKRSFFKMRLIALFLTLILAASLLIAIILLVVGQHVIDWLFSFGILDEDIFYYTIIFLRFAVVFVAFYLAIASIYYWGPAIHSKWHFFSLGSIIATFLCVVVSFGFSIYINNFATYNKVYGSIGTLIGFMLWQYLMSAILLLGFEFNASIDRATDPKIQELNKSI